MRGDFPHVSPLLRDWVHHQTGMRIDERNISHVQAVLRMVSREAKCEAQAYVDQILAGSIDPQPLIDKVTVHESFFLRNRENLDFVCEKLMPTLTADCAPNAVRILSAGCAQGEEAYSVAILLREFGISSSQFEIVGIDVARSCITKAQSGIYSDYAFRFTSNEFLETYFSKLPDGKFEIEDAIKKSTRFMRMDLITQALGVLRSTFDIILCQNLLFYMSPNSLDQALRVLRDLLRPGGWLLVDPSEAPLPKPYFSVNHVSGLTLFQKTDDEGKQPPPFFKDDFRPVSRPSFLHPLLASTPPLEPIAPSREVSQRRPSFLKPESTQDSKPARKVSEPPKKKYKQGDELLSLARTAYKEKDFSKAYKLFAEVEAFGISYKAKSMLGRAEVLADSGEEIEAIELAENSISLVNSHKAEPILTRDELVRAHSLIALLLAKRNLREEAKPHVKKVAQLDPKHIILRLFQNGY